MDLLLNDLFLWRLDYVMVVVLPLLPVMVSDDMQGGFLLFLAGLLTVLVRAVGVLLADPLLAAGTRLAHDSDRHFHESPKLLVHHLHFLEALYFSVE